MSAEITVGDLANDDSVAGMARTVLAARPQRFALAGLSLGGIVAFEIMRRAPERVSRLALLDTNPLPPRPEQLAAWAELGGLAEAGRLDQVVDRLLPGLFRPGWRADERAERAVHAMADRVGAAAYGRQLRPLAGRADSRQPWEPSLPHPGARRAAGCLDAGGLTRRHGRGDLERGAGRLWNNAGISARWSNRRP